MSSIFHPPMWLRVDPRSRFVSISIAEASSPSTSRRRESLFETDEAAQYLFLFSVMSLVHPHFDILTLNKHVNSKYFAIAILTWVLHEMLITLDDTVNLFWMHHLWSMSISKFLFFINRIAVVLTAIMIIALNFASFPSGHSCKVVASIQFFGSTVIISILSWTLAIRVYALWKGLPIVLTLFFLATLANVITFPIIYGSALYNGAPQVGQSPFTGCYVPTNSNLMWLTFFAGLVFETLSIGLIIFKAWPQARLRYIRSPISSLLIEDGVVYYLAFIASILLIVGAIYVPTPISSIVLSSSPGIIVPSLAINRLLIHLQDVLIKRPTTTEVTNADFSRNGESHRLEAITTIAGSNPVGRIHAVKMDDELGHGA